MIWISWSLRNFFLPINKERKTDFSFYNFREIENLYTKLRTAFRRRVSTRVPSSFLSSLDVKVVIFCRDDLEIGESQNIGWNARWKYRDWIDTICFPIFRRRFSSFTNSSEKTRIWWSLPVEIIKIMKKQHEKLGANIIEQLMSFTIAVKSDDYR